MASERTSSTILNESLIPRFFSQIDSKFSLETCIIASETSLSLFNPSFASFFLFLPSNLKGVVTIETLNAPTFFAIFAITGAAPVPVPPPRPVAINTKSEPTSIPWIDSSDSKAEFSPTSGFIPAPRPFVKDAPICIL